MIEIEQLSWKKSDGLIPAVVQDHQSGQVLMLAFMNRESLQKTLEGGLVTFWSRSRQALWTKGETSGNYLRVKEIRVDCDSDSVLVIAHPQGPACHRGTRSCFGQDDEFSALEFLGHLERLVEGRRKEMPDGSYTTSLFSKGLHEIAKKVGEEGVEMALSIAESKERSVEEAGDLLYHLLVLLSERGIEFSDVIAELRQRHLGAGPSHLHDCEPGARAVQSRNEEEGDASGIVDDA